jgi:hypothetical protein
MHLDGFITLPTFRPDGRLDRLNKGEAEFRDFWVDWAGQAKAKEGAQKRGSRPVSSGGQPQSFPRRSAPRPVTSVSSLLATAGNHVGAKRKSLLGAATS